MEQSRRAQAEPISLDSCLKAFTSEEELGEDELYYCSKCKTHRLATKKLDLWRLPPILVSGTLLSVYFFVRRTRHVVFSTINCTENGRRTDNTVCVGCLFFFRLST